LTGSELKMHSALTPINAHGVGAQNAQSGRCRGTGWRWSHVPEVVWPRYACACLAMRRKRALTATMTVLKDMSTAPIAGLRIMPDP